MFHVHTNHPSCIMCYFVHIYSIQGIVTITTCYKGQLISKVLNVNKYKKGLIVNGRIARTSKLITSPQYATNLFPICFNLFNAFSISNFPTIKFHFKDANGNGTIHFVATLENYISLYLEPLYYFSIIPNFEERLFISIIGDLAPTNH